MKKLISLLLMVCMVALLVPAMAEGVVGTWYAVSMSEGEMTISPADMGMSVTMTLNEDGTALLESSGMDEPQTGTWTQDGDKVIIVDANGEEEEAILADGTLTLTEGEMIMVFSQEEPQNSAAAAEAVLADSEDAFYGTWIVDKIEIEGTFYSLSMLENIGMNVEIIYTIEAGKAEMSFKMGENELGPVELPVTFEDGMLKVTNTPLTIQLADDGGILTELPEEANLDGAIHLMKAE